MKKVKENPIAIPKIIHFIWAGGTKPVKEGEMRTIAEWAVENPDFELNLWVDEKTSNTSLYALNELYQNKFETAYRRVCQSKGILREQVPKVLRVRDIRQENICAKEGDIIDYELDRVDPNYGASSNILRYRVLFKEGGVYLDCDVSSSDTPLMQMPEFNECNEHVLYVDHLSQIKRSKLDADVLNLFPLKRDKIGNDAFICTTRNPLMLQCIQHVEDENYQLARIYSEK